MPNKEERKDIFKIHIKNKNKRLDEAALNSVSQTTEGFNGADIESVVNEAVEKCFIDSLDNKGTVFDEKLLKGIASDTISISKSCNKQIENMKKAFKENNFKDATTGDVTK